VRIVRKKNLMKKSLAIITLAVLFLTGAGCGQTSKIIPHEQRWGIYSLDLSAENVQLIYGSAEKISGLRLSNNGDKFVFTQITGDNGGAAEGTVDTREEIMSIDADGKNPQRLTDNSVLDTYPAWSSDDSRIYFLSWRKKDLDIYTMNADGSNAKPLYDSSSNDADIDTIGDKIVFTKNSQIWIMGSDGTNLAQVTNPPRAGEWRKTNLPFGDYDPRLSPDGGKIVFERLESDANAHGNYNLYAINSDGTNETRLTDNGYSQGLASWSHSGDKIVYIVSAMGDEGKYDIFMMASDGTNNKNITPNYFPPDFLVHSAIFSKDDSKIFFIGEWWSN